MFQTIVIKMRVTERKQFTADHKLGAPEEDVRSGFAKVETRIIKLRTRKS